MYQTILVPTDFSDPAEVAWDHAVDLAKATGAKLVVCYVVEPVLSHYGVVGLVPAVSALEEEHDVKSRLELQALVEKAKGAGLNVESRIAQGKPWRVIVEAADQAGADLIVMGTHGRTGFSHEALGSTAERVVQRAQCPVLVVRPPKAG